MKKSEHQFLQKNEVKGDWYVLYVLQVIENGFYLQAYGGFVVLLSVMIDADEINMWPAALNME